MKNLLFVLFLLFLLPYSSYAQQERITNFDVKLQVNTDRSISVVETISVIATGQQIKRGITRNFPSTRTLNDRSVNMEYNIERVLKNGEPEPFFTESTNQGFMVYIGQREMYLPSGNYTYIIEYKVPNQIGFFEDYDEIYWNAIGTDVVFPIDKASCQVRLPQGVAPIQESAYLGYRGEKNKAYTLQTYDNVLNYTADRSLKPNEAFTVSVGFSKGVVDQPGLFSQYGTMIVVILGLLFLFPYYIYTWWRYGQDPPTPASYPIWEPPNNMSPASINYISKEGYQSKSFTASIISMAIKGYLKIEEKDKSGIFTSSKIYELVRLKDADVLLLEEEERLFDSLFSGRDVVSIDGEYHSYVESAYAVHKNNLNSQHQAFIKKGNNLKFITIPLLASILIGALAIFLFARDPYAQGVNLIAIFAFAGSAIVGLILYIWLIKKPTTEKLDLKSKIKGYKMYLELAEKDRLNLLNPPEFTPQHFEEALPFAFALGVEHTWSDKFKTILEAAKYQPDWNDSSNPAYFYGNFGNNFSQNLSGSATKPQESGGGSGSGGGGFSGGGGGGGGVGGW